MRELAPPTRLQLGADDSIPTKLCSRCARIFTVDCFYRTHQRCKWCIAAVDKIRRSERARPRKPPSHYGPLPGDPLKRFLKYVTIGTPTECWVWRGAGLRSGAGYGRFWVAKGRNVNASRFIYEYLYGALHSDIFVCHKCDNPSCVNPFHLFPGTRRDNVIDAINKGRQPWQTALVYRPYAKLTPDIVRSVRTACTMGASMRAQARIVGVSEATIRSVVHRETWLEVA